MGTFPNKDTQIGQPRGPKPGCRPGKSPLGKRRARTLRHAAKKAALIVGEVVQEFQGDSLALLQQVYRDTSLPLDMRLAAARIAAPFENPTLSAAEPRSKGMSFEQLVAQAILPPMIEGKPEEAPVVTLDDQS